MSADVGFVLFFALTLVFLGLVVATGLRAKRRWHLLFVACALASLVATIVWALRLGEHYDLRSAGVITPIHLFIAKMATVAYVFPLLTGLRTIFHPKTRSLHRKCAFVALGLTVLAAITGVLMLAMATRID